MTTTLSKDLAGTYVADPIHSSFQFGVRYMGVSLFRAGFSDVQATLTDGVLDGRAKVESISITNPPEFREHVVNGADFFDAGNHPEIGFRSDSIELGDGDTATVHGELEIKGIRKPLTARGTYTPPTEHAFGGVRAALELSARVDRRDWELSWNAPLPKGGDALANEVEVTVNLILAPEAA